VGTEHVAINHYQVPAGEGLPSGLHAHYDQEEVFVVLAGEATFETLREGEVTVGARAAIRFPRRVPVGSERRRSAAGAVSPRSATRHHRHPHPIPLSGLWVRSASAEIGRRDTGLRLS
jgi:hypothetical protein